VKRKPKVSADALEAMTGHDRRWWMWFVQKRIAACSGPKEKDGHSRMTSYDWVGDVIRELFKSFPKDGPAYDPNMRIAFLTTYVFGVWYTRLHHSKTFDPRRPKKIRQESYKSWHRSLNALFSAFTDESEDPFVFNGKPNYENPFDPKAKNGKFI
jgi:hypothetical protein